MKDGLKKQLACFPLIIVMLSTVGFSLVTAGEKSYKSEETGNTVTVTVEKSTLGQDYYLEPTQVEICSGDTIKSLLNKTIGSSAVWNENKLTAIIGAQSETVSIPAAISAMGENDSSEAAPTTDSALATGVESADRLSEKDYSSMSAWMFSINNKLIGSSAGDISIHSGDVIRVQFSVWGNGADLGQSLAGNIAANNEANKDVLIGLLGKIRASTHYIQYLKNDDFNEIYHEALSTAKQLQVAQSSVNSIFSQLQDEISALMETVDFEGADLDAEGNGAGIDAISAGSDSEAIDEVPVVVVSDEDQAKEITNRINALPEKNAIMISDKDAVDQIQQAYEVSSETVKNLIEENAFNKLHESIERIRELEKVKQLIERIQSLPESTQLRLSDEETIKSIRNIYETELNDGQRELISTDAINKLISCEKRITEIKKENQLLANQTMALISDMPLPGTLTLTGSEEVIKARSAYENLTVEQKALVTNLNVLASAQAKLGELITQAIEETKTDNIQMESAEINGFVEACKVYDEMAALNQMVIKGETKNRMLEIQKTIKNMTGTCNGVTVDAPWHVVVKAEEISATSTVFKNTSAKISERGSDLKDLKLLKLYKISYEDLYTYHSNYEIKDGAEIHVILPDIANKSDYLNLNVWNVSDKGEVILSAKNEAVSGSDRIGVKASKFQYTAITGDNSKEVLNTALSANTSLSSDLSSAYKGTAAYMLVAAAQPTIQSGLWETICFARSGYAVPEGYYNLYYNNVVAELQEGNGSISGDRTNTDYSKTIISLAAIGKDPKNVGGYNLLNKLANYDKIKRGGMMAYVWALIALDSNDYEIPVTDTGTQTTRDLLIKTILAREVVTSSGTRGGFSLYSESADASPDTDVTAMTLQSLAKYKDREDVKPVIERALTVLSGLQNDNGSYGTFGAPETSESTSQVVLALTSLGIDPGTDGRFIKGGNNTLNDLMTYYVSGGGFMHIKAGGTSNGGAAPGALNGMASYQASQAIIAYNRFKEGKTWIFRVTDGFNAVINNNTTIDDLVNEYNKRFRKSGTSTETVIGTTAAATGSSAGGTSTGTPAATAASAKGAGTTAAETAFTPWSFDGSYVPKTESSEVVETDAEKDKIYQNNKFFLGAFGLGVVVVVIASKLVNKRKKIKNGEDKQLDKI